MFRTAQTGSANRNLLPVHHTIAVLFSPAVGAALGVLLMTLSRQVPHFFFHDQVHQSQSRLTQQVADSFLQQAHDLGHGKDHLDVGILFARQLAELLHRALLIDLVSSLHSDSLLFPWRKKLPSAHYDRGVRVATFYELTGILPGRYSSVLRNNSSSSLRLLTEIGPKISSGVLKRFIK